MIELPPTLEEALLALVRETGLSDSALERAAKLGHGFLSSARRGRLHLRRNLGRKLPDQALWTKLAAELMNRLGVDYVQAAINASRENPPAPPPRGEDLDAVARDAAQPVPADLVERARRSPEGLGWLAGTHDGKAWTAVRHLQLLDRVLLDAVTGRSPSVLVSMPPAHAKSEMVSRLLPAWFLGRCPDRRVLLCSHEASFAAKWGRHARDLLTEVGPSVFGVRVDDASSAAAEWGVAGRRGGMITAGAGGSIGGRRCDVLIVDDPFNSWEDASSEPLRERIWWWWLSTASTRREPDCITVVLQTRWHEDDLIGHLLRGEGEHWRHVRLPAFAEDNDPMGRAPGEALWPEKWSAERLTLEASKRPPSLWAGLYQQRPAPEGGGLFKAAWFSYAEPPPLDRLVLRFATVDLAASSKTSADYTVILVAGLAADGRLHVLDVRRERLEGPQIVPALHAATKRWRLDVIGVEAVAFQLALVQIARAAGLPVREIRRDRDKVTRALAATPALEAGKVVWSAHAPWRVVLEDELLSFPGGRHDDQADALADAVTLGRTFASYHADPVAPSPSLPRPSPVRDLAPARTSFADLAPGGNPWA